MANNQRQLLLSTKANNRGLSMQEELGVHYEINQTNIKADGFILPLPFTVPRQIASRTTATKDLLSSLNALKKLNDETNIRYVVVVTENIAIAITAGRWTDNRLTVNDLN